MADLLTGKAAVVTGGSSGIGRAIALAFAREGANVVVADVVEDPKEGGRPTAEEIREEYDVNAAFVECDVSNPADLEATVAAADEFGGIDVMVNNAGILMFEDFLETGEEDYDRLMSVNAKGAYFGTQAAAKRMVENGGGSVVNLSSIAGLVGNGDYPTYSMSKGAIKSLTQSIAHGLGPEGVRVNSIHPGSIETTIAGDQGGDMTEEQREMFLQQIPLRRNGKPEDVADVAVFLASDLSRYVTGEQVVVDGGWIAHN